MCRVPRTRARSRCGMLREAGWTAVRVPRGVALSELWRQADRERSGLGRPQRRGGTVMSGRARLALCAWAATLLTACALLPLVETVELAPPGGHPAGHTDGRGRARPAGAAGLAADGGGTARSSPCVLLTLVFAREQAFFGLIPGPDAFQQFGTLLRTGADDVGRYAIPAPLVRRHTADAGRRRPADRARGGHPRGDVPQRGSGRPAAARAVLGRRRALRRRRRLAVVPAGGGAAI